MKKIRVLHVVRKMGFGGIETFLMSIYRNIDKEKVQFDFLVNEKGEFDQEIKSLGGNVFYIDYLGKVGPIKYKRNLFNFFKNNKYNIVHSHYGQISGLILEAAKKAGVRIRIAHSHSTAITKTNKLLMIYKKIIQRKINKNATLLLSCSDDASKFLFTNKANKAILIYNSIDIDNFIYNTEYRNIIRKQYDIKDNEILIGHVGRFCHQKNQTFLIEMFSKLDKKYRLMLIGDGKDKEKIKSLIKENNLNNRVVIINANNEVNKYYSAMDLFCFPSNHEGLGIVSVEAQSNGLPCLVSNKVPKEVKVNDNLYFLDLDVDTWIDKIENIEISRTKNNNIYMSKYNIKNTAKILEKIYMDN